MGKSRAHKVMLLAAVAFHLGKYMKFKPTKSVSMAMALEEELEARPRGGSLLLSCATATAAS
jgi:hypothetical protein